MAELFWNVLRSEHHLQLMRTDIYISEISDIQYTKSLQTTLVLATGRSERSAQLANLIFSEGIHSKLLNF